MTQLNTVPLITVDENSEKNPNEARPCLYQTRKWVSVIISMTSYIFVYFHRFSTAVLAEDMAEDFGISQDKIGILASMYFWPYGLVQPFIGSLADIIEPGYMIGFANLCAAIGSMMCGFSTNLTIACVGRFFVGLGCGTIFVPTNKIGVNWFTAKQFRFFAGAMIGLGGCGSLLSQMPLSLLGEKIGWRMCLKSTSIIGAFLGICAFIWVRGHPATVGFRGHSKLEETSGLKQIFSQLFKNLFVMVKIRNFWFLESFMFFAPGVLMVLSSLWGVPYLENVHHCSSKKASFVQMAISASLIIGSPTMPIIAELTKSRKWTLFTFCGISTAGCLYLALAKDTTPLWLVTALYFIIGYGASACQGTALPLFKEFYDERLAATLVGGGNTGPFIGGGILQIISSTIIGTYDHPGDVYPVKAYEIGLWGLSAICCFIAMLSLLFIREPKIEN